MVHWDIRMSTENAFIIYIIFTLCRRWYIVMLRCCVFCNTPMYQEKLANLVCCYVGMSQKNAHKLQFYTYKLYLSLEKSLLLI